MFFFSFEVILCVLTRKITSERKNKKCNYRLAENKFFVQMRRFFGSSPYPLSFGARDEGGTVFILGLNTNPARLPFYCILLWHCIVKAVEVSM